MENAVSAADNFLFTLKKGRLAARRPRFQQAKEPFPFSREK